MTVLPPKISKEELKVILIEDVQFPDGITEEQFQADIQFNSQINWRTNPFLRKRVLLGYLLSRKQLKKWKISKIADTIIVLGMIVFAVFPFNPWIFLFVLAYTFVTQPYDHWIFIFNLSALIIVDLIFNIPIPDLWFFITMIVAGYVVRKMVDEMIERQILRQALSSFENFWRFYSNKLIWLDPRILKGEYERLTEKYEDLRP